MPDISLPLQTGQCMLEIIISDVRTLSFDLDIILFQDWLMWFTAFQNYQSNPWLLHLMGKMLENDPVVDSLIAKNPFRGKEPPVRIRARHYKVI